MNSLTISGSYSAENFCRDRLGLVAHAREFGRRDVVDLHALGLELVDRRLRLLAADLALIIARFVGRILQDLLLVRRQLVPELLADQDDVGAVGVVGDAEIFLHLVELVRTGSPRTDFPGRRPCVVSSAV